MLLQHAVLVPLAPERLFDLIVQPRCILELAPPDMNLSLLAGPERYVLGSASSWQIRRLGIAQRLDYEVTSLEPNASLTLEQRHGPFQSFRHEQRLTPVPGGVRLEDRIEIMPPSGLLGFFLTESMISRDFQAMLAHRDRLLAEKYGVLADPSQPPS